MRLTPMNLLTYLSAHLFHWLLIGVGVGLGLCVALGLVGIAGEFLLAIFYPIYAFTLKPFVWATKKLFQSRCPQCKGFFRKKIVDSEISDEREVLRTVNRVDQGVLYSRHLLEPNQTIEVSRKEQVTFVEQTIRNHWACKNPDCGYQWDTEETFEYEGALSN